MIAEHRVKFIKALDMVIKANSKPNIKKLDEAILYLESVIFEIKSAEISQVEKDRMLLYKIAKILGIK